MSLSTIPGDFLGHKSGLPDYWHSPLFQAEFDADPSRRWQPEEMLRFAGEMSPACTEDLVGDDDCFSYADTNYVVLGLVIQHLSGHSLEEVLRWRIYDRLGLSCTWMKWNESPPATCTGRLSSRYEGRLDVTVLPNQSADWSGGGLATTLDDLAVFMRSLVQGKLIQDPGLMGELLK